MVWIKAIAVAFILVWGQAAAFAQEANAGRTQVGSGTAQAYQTSINSDQYVLGPGDTVKVRVFQEPDLTDDYAVGPNGEISVPLAGRVKASGLTTAELAVAISDALAQGYLDSANVSVEIMEFRPFYIFGEVTTPGDYPYAAGMNIIKAIATAGGYTYRAKKSIVYIQRGGVGEEVKEKVKSTTVVLPGDVVRVPERFF